jgi:uncharacterized SAM-binding protein YcdF (DUF218 family)
MRPPERPFALVVLGSSRRSRGGGYSISRACRRAVGHAERYAWRRVPQVVVFSGWAPDGALPEAEQMRATWRGPQVELVVEPTASTTAENAARTLPFVARRGLPEAVVVCLPLHLYRARWFFRRLYEPRRIRTTFTTPPTMPTLSAVVWELGALTVRSRQLRAVEQELRRFEAKP